MGNPLGKFPKGWMFDDDDVVMKIVLALHKHAEVYRKSSKMVSGFDETKMDAFTGGVPMHNGAKLAYEIINK